MLCRFLFLLFFAPVFAQAQTSETSTSPGSALLQMLSGLTLVIALMILAAFLLRKFYAGKGFGNTGPMRIVGGLMLSARERIVLVEIGEVWLVVGIVPGQIKTLHTLPKGDPAVVADVEKSFAHWLGQFSGKKNEA